MKRWLCVLVTVMLLPMVGVAEELTGMTVEDVVARMGIGWNLGNTFDATGGNTSDVYSQEKSMGNPKVTAELIRKVKAAGFTTIRIPVTWYLQLLDDGEYTINPAFLARVKEVVDMAFAEDLFVIINMHHEEWLNCKTLDTDYVAIGNQLAAIWAQLADAFAEYDQHLIFEAMNEPRMKGADVEWLGNEGGIAAVNYLNQLFVNVIRSNGKGHNAERALMLPTYAASCSSAQMIAWQMPEWQGAPAENIIVSIHSYTPYDFCLSDKMKNFNRLFASHTMPIDMVFYTIKGVFLDKGIPVVIGETSATNKGNTEAREQWAYYMGMKSASYGIPIIVWDNGSYGKTGGERHVWIHRNAERHGDQLTPFPTVLQALFDGAASVE